MSCNSHQNALIIPSQDKNHWHISNVAVIPLKTLSQVNGPDWKPSTSVSVSSAVLKGCCSLGKLLSLSVTWDLQRRTKVRAQSLPLLGLCGYWISRRVSGWERERTHLCCGNSFSRYDLKLGFIHKRLVFISPVWSGQWLCQLWGGWGGVNPVLQFIIKPVLVLYQDFTNFYWSVQRLSAPKAKYRIIDSLKVCAEFYVSPTELKERSYRCLIKSEFIMNTCKLWVAKIRIKNKIIIKTYCA